MSNTISISNSNTTGITNRAGPANPSGVHEFTPAFSGVHDAQPLIFSLVFCRSLFVFFLLAIVLSVLRCTASDYIPLISLNCSYTKTDVFLLNINCDICYVDNYMSCSYFHSTCSSWRGVLDTTLCDKVCQRLATRRCFYSDTRRFPPPIKLTATI